MKANLYFLLAVAFLGTTTATNAQTCGGLYTVAQGDSLSWIADKLYKDAGKWTAIHSNNINVVGENPNAIRIGQRLRLTCIDGLPADLEGGTDIADLQSGEVLTDSLVSEAPSSPKNTQVSNVSSAASAPSRAIRVLTGDDFAPYTDRSLPNGGMLAEIVTEAMNNSASQAKFMTFWINDWAPHLDPLLTQAVFDIGYPWAQPACDLQPDSFRCVNFNFSDPLFEMLMLLYVRKDRPMAFNTDEEMHGKTLCRPAGYSTYIFEKNSRNWLSRGKINLKQPPQVADCFEMLVEGKVDGVVLNDFTGRAAIKDLNLKDKVIAVDTRPVSIETLHVLVGKKHPQSQEMMDTINSGLKAIRETGKYQQVLDTHMTRIWAEF